MSIATHLIMAAAGNKKLLPDSGIIYTIAAPGAGPQTYTQQVLPTGALGILQNFGVNYMTSSVVDYDGNAYFACNNPTGGINKLAADGSATALWVQTGSPLDKIFVGTDNTLYATQGVVIKKITQAGTVSSLGSLIGTRIPKSITIDPFNNFYWLNYDSGGNITYITKIASNGTVTNNFANLGSGTFNGILICDWQGNIYSSAAFVNNTVTKIAPNGTVTTSWATVTNAISGGNAIVDEYNNLYFGNNTNGITKITPSGVVNNSWASGIAYGTWFCIDNSWNIYGRTDSGTNIAKVSSAGSVNSSWAPNPGPWPFSYSPEAASIFHVKSIPTAPTIGTATVSSATSAAVSFTPNFTGYNSVTYTVTSSPSGITATGTSSPITVTGLTTGVSYTFTVTATNAIGTSAASSASNSVTMPVAGTVFSSNEGTGGNTITKVSIAGSGSTFASISSPSGSVLDAAGNLYVYYGASNKIAKIDSAGNVNLTWATGITAAGARAALVIDSTGNIFGIGGDSRVFKVTPAGVVTNSWASLSYTTGFAGQSTIAIDSSDNIYIGNPSNANGRVTKITPVGSVNESWFTNFNSLPQCIIVDASDNIWTGNVSGGNGNITKINSAGTQSGFWFISGDYPKRIAANPNGEVFAALQSNLNVVKISSGTLSTLVSSASSTQIRGFIADNSSVYVGDDTASIIYKYDASSGSTSATITLAANAQPAYFAMQK